MSSQFVEEMRFKSFVKFRLITDDPYALIRQTIPNDWQFRKRMIRSKGKSSRWSIKIIIIPKRDMTLAFPPNGVGDPCRIERIW